MALLEALPDELIQHILHYLPPQDTLAHVLCLSRRLHRVAREPLLWKHYCQSTFRYWQRDHRFQDKLGARAQDVDWAGLFVLRLQRTARVARLLDSIVGSRVLRIHRIEQICRLGYDAKDYLLAQCRADESAPDVLARRYFACKILDSIHRGLAIEEWAKSHSHKASSPSDADVPDRESFDGGMKLERALGAFDMFMPHQEEGELDEVRVTPLVAAYPRLLASSSRSPRCSTDWPSSFAALFHASTPQLRGKRQWRSHAGCGGMASSGWPRSHGRILVCGTT